ncbi:MAG: hypothetical protein ABFD52_08990 [Acidobacteriota bacterium]
MINVSVLAKLIAFKFGYSLSVARAVAEDMIHDDFPKNGITTAGGVIVYLDYVKSLLRPKEA